MQSNSIKLTELVKRIQSNLFEIPHFQRDFVWSESQVRLLIDSLARNYPIGALLLSDKLDLPLASRPINAFLKEESLEGDLLMEASIKSSFVLDGQQRLTSIARVFLNGNPKNNYYFDLLDMYDNFESILQGSPITWIRVRARGKYNHLTKEGGRFLRCDLILDAEDSSVNVNQFFQNHFYGEETKIALRAAAKVNKIFEAIRNYEISYIQLNGKEGVDSICRVFETINSTGTRLTTFDLAVARYFPNPNLRELYEQSLKNNHLLSKAQFDVDGERILQIIALKNKIEQGEFPETARSALLKIDSEYIHKNWDIAVNSLVKAIEWSIIYCGSAPSLSLPHSFLVSLGTLFALRGHEKLVNRPGFNIALRKWIFSVNLQDGTKRVTNYDVGSDLMRLLNFVDKDEALPNFQVSITSDELIALHKSNTKFRSIQSIMRIFCRDDLFSGKTIGIDAEFHHIYPKALHKKFQTIDKKNIDSIANLMLITKSTNLDISDTLPSEYFSEYASHAEKYGLLDDYNKRLAQHFIPLDLKNDDIESTLGLSCIDKFLADRSKMILEKIKEIIGDSLVEIPRSDSEDLEDD